MPHDAGDVARGICGEDEGVPTDAEVARGLRAEAVGAVAGGGEANDGERAAIRREGDDISGNVVSLLVLNGNRADVGNHARGRRGCREHGSAEQPGYQEEVSTEVHAGGRYNYLLMTLVFGERP